MIPGMSTIFSTGIPRVVTSATFALNEGLYVLRVCLDMGLVGLIVSEQGRNTTP